MTEVSIASLGLAKHVFQVHAASADGGLVLRKSYLAFMYWLSFGASEMYRCDGE